MMRPLAAMAVVCLLVAGCLPSEPEPTPPEVAPAPQAVVPDMPKGAPAAPAGPESVVGEHVQGLTDDWLQGEASVQGAQLVVFFELWCPHCRRELPRMTTLEDRVDVVALTRMSKDVGADQVLKFAQDNDMTYPIGRTPDALARQLKVRGIPAAALLRDGKVLWRGHPGRLTDEMLTDLLSG